MLNSKPHIIVWGASKFRTREKHPQGEFQRDLKIYIEVNGLWLDFEIYCLESKAIVLVCCIMDCIGYLKLVQAFQALHQTE